MFDFLFKPYPYLYTSKRLPIILAALFVVSLSFLYLFRPFDVHYSDHRYNYFVLSLIKTLSVCVIFFGFISCFNLIFGRRASENNWNICKETILFAFACLLIGIGAFLTREVVYISQNNLSWEHFYLEIGHTFLVGGVLFTLFTVLNYYRLSILYENKERIIGRDLDVENDQATVVIDTFVKNDKFELKLDEFIFAKAEGNYVEFYIGTSANIHKKLVRMSLKSLEDQLEHYTYILRTHRAFIVNKKKITNVSGNALGFELEFDSIDHRIPVARGNVRSFKKAMNLS